MGNLNTEIKKRQKKIKKLELSIRRLGRVSAFDTRYSKLGVFSESNEKVGEMKNQMLQLKKELKILENERNNG